MTISNRCTVLFLLACSMVLLASCSSSLNNGASTAGSTANGSSLPSQWIVGWGASPQNALITGANPGGNEQSYRFIVVPTIAGTQERVRFSNYFGTSAITVGAARLAVASGSGPAVDTTHDAALTFSGAKSLTLQPGEEVYSDPVNITYTYGQKLAVSVYMQGTFPSLTEHDSQAGTNFMTASGAGDATGDASGTSFTGTTSVWFVISNVDVYGPYAGTVAVFGSSSMDGHASNYGDTNAYPIANTPVAGQDHDRPSDWLGVSLNAANIPVGVLNAGLLADAAAPDNNDVAGTSIAGINRIDHDVLQQSGIKAVVIYIGGIDLRGDCRSAPAIEQTLNQIVAKANAAGLRVILATIPPSEYCLTAQPLPSSSDPYAGDITPGPENPGSVQRRALNSWIRASGAQLPGVVSIADFDAVLADPDHPDFMIPNLNSGDNFHPNGPGYGVQNGAIDINSILGQ